MLVHCKTSNKKSVNLKYIEVLYLDLISMVECNPLTYVQEHSTLIFSSMFVYYNVVSIIIFCQEMHHNFILYLNFIPIKTDFGSWSYLSSDKHQ